MGVKMAIAARVVRQSVDKSIFCSSIQRLKGNDMLRKRCME